jgi:hypothetical protein
MTDDRLHRTVARMARELADKDREIMRLDAECTRLAQRNTVLVCEIDRVKEEVMASIRNELYRGEG